MLVIVERIGKRRGQLVCRLPKPRDAIVLIVGIIELISAIYTGGSRIAIMGRLLNGATNSCRFTYGDVVRRKPLNVIVVAERCLEGALVLIKGWLLGDNVD